MLKNIAKIVFLGIITLSTYAGAKESPKIAEPTTKMSPRQKFLLYTVDTGEWKPDKNLFKIISLPKGKGNAGMHYAKLERLYIKDRINKDSIEVKTDGKGISEILKAATMRECKLSDFYPNMDKGTEVQPDMIVFQAYLFALIKRAKELEDKGDAKAADLVYRSGLIWGWHFSKERPNLVTFLISLSIKARVSKEYSRFLQRQLDIPKSTLVREYHSKVLRMRRKVFIKARMHLGEFGNFNCLYSTIMIAKSDKDYLWRQEAVLRLGVLRHGAPDSELNNIVKDKFMQSEAEKALMYVSENDKKPWIRKLALWSIQSVTPERFKEMRRLTLKKDPDEK